MPVYPGAPSAPPSTQGPVHQGGTDAFVCQARRLQCFFLQLLTVAARIGASRLRSEPRPGCPLGRERIPRL